MLKKKEKRENKNQASETLSLFLSLLSLLSLSLSTHTEICAVLEAHAIAIDHEAQVLQGATGHRHQVLEGTRVGCRHHHHVHTFL